MFSFVTGGWYYECASRPVPLSFFTTLVLRVNYCLVASFWALRLFVLAVLRCGCLLCFGYKFILFKPW